MNENKNISPFKFLDSYTQGDRDIFYGREKEVEEVYSKTFQSPMLLVYGASGTGKSSIINCGLANKFNDSDWLPIHIRRGGNIRTSMFQQIQKNAVNKVDLSPKEELSNEGLIKAVNSVFLDHFKPIYLIFDQFEELFIFGFKDEWNDFISAVKSLLERDLEVRLIFVIRGEYLEFLSEFEDELPSFFDNRVRIEKMTRKNAEESISGPVSKFPIDLEKGFEENLIKKLSPESSQVELTFLQVFLDKVYKMALEYQDKNERLKFTNEQIEKLGQIGDVLAEFVDEQIFKMPNPKEALTVLKSFVSLQGTKMLRNNQEVIEYTRDIGQEIKEQSVDSIISQLINKRILKEQDDNGRYELRHDSLAEKIFEKITVQEREILDAKQFLKHSFNEYQKRGTLLKDEDLIYLGPHLRQIKLDQELTDFINKSRQNSTKRKKQKRTRNIIVAVISLLFVTSVIALIFARQQKQRAEESAIVAKNEAEAAEKQKQIAIQQENIAREQAEIANEQKSLAEQSKLETEKQKSIAVEQRQIAEEQKQEAILARSNAEQNAIEAQKQKALALREKEIAEEQKQIANTLRMHTLARELALKSQHVVEPSLKALLAVQAYDFNMEYYGNPHQAEIYEALYFANRNLKTDLIKEIRVQTKTIKSLKLIGSNIYAASSEGRISRINENLSSIASPIFNSDYPIESMDITADERFAIIGTNLGKLVKIDINTSSEIGNIQLEAGEIRNLSIHHNQVYAFGQKGQVLILDMNLQIVNESLSGFEITSAEMTDSQIFLGDLKGSVHILDLSLKETEVIQPYDKQKVSSLEINSKQDLLAIGYYHGEIILWDLNENKAKEILPGHSSSITDFAFSDNSDYLISGSYDRSLRLWSLKEKQLTPYVIPDHQNWVSNVEFGNNSNYIYSSDFNGNLRKIPLQNSELKKELCSVLDRDLSREEWNEYISEDIRFKSTCDE